MLPSIAGLVALAEPIVRLLFQRGAFTTTATQLTAACVQMYTLGLIGQSLFPVFHRVFYSFKDTRTPLIVGLAMITVNAFTDLAVWQVVRRGRHCPLDDCCCDGGYHHGHRAGAQVLPRHRAHDTAYPLVREILKTSVAVLPVIGIAMLGKSWIGVAQTFVGTTLRLLVVCGTAALVYIGCQCRTAHRRLARPSGAHPTPRDALQRGAVHKRAGPLTKRKAVSRRAQHTPVLRLPTPAGYQEPHHGCLLFTPECCVN